jgi:hypothetical protein
MRRLNNLRLEKINSRVFKNERERLLDFGNMRHEQSYSKWRVVIQTIGDPQTIYIDKTWWGISSPLPFAYKNKDYLKKLQKSFNGEFLFTYHKHYQSPYKEYDMRGILFNTAEHKALFILKYGNVLSNTV